MSNNIGEEPQFDHYESSIIKEYFVLHKFPHGGFVKRHRLVKEENDYLAVYQVAYEKAARGSKVFILPELNENDPLREMVFHGAKTNKCPDLKIDGEFTEVKTPLPELHNRKIKNNIQYAYRQANRVIINLVAYYDKKVLKSIAKERLLEHKELEIIEFRCFDGSYLPFERKIMIKK